MTFFQLVQLKHAISARWKTLISNSRDIDERNLYQNHTLAIKGARIFSKKKISSEEIYIRF